MPYSLTGNKISHTYERVVQFVSGSYYDGAGNPLNLSGSETIYYTGSTYPITSSYSRKATYLTGSGSVTTLGYNTSYVSTGTERLGTMFLDGGDETIATVLQNGAVLQVGQEMHFYARATDADIHNGELIQFAGVSGTHVLAKKAVASEIIANPHYLIGLATTDFVRNDYGYVTWFGKVNDVYTKTPANGDTQDWAAGDVLYFNNTTGQLTNIEPDAPQRRIIIAAVIAEQNGATQTGKLLVRPTFGMKLTDLDDIDGRIATVTGDLLAWDNDNQVFDILYNINNYVPYSGSSQNVDLNTNSISASYFVGTSSYSLKDRTSLITTTTSDLTLNSSLHYTVLVDCTTGVKTITLPAAESNFGTTFNVKKIDASGYKVTVDTIGGNTIDGDLTKDILYRYSNMKVQASGSQYFIL